MPSESESHSVMSNAHRLYSPWNFPGQSTGVGSLFLLLGIFPSKGSNLGLPHCILYLLSHKGSPRILEWVAIPSPADLPNPGIEPGSHALQADSLPAELSGKYFIISENNDLKTLSFKKACISRVDRSNMILSHFF